jgi:hypothetical protein
LGTIAGHQAYPLAYGTIVMRIAAAYRCILPRLFPSYFQEKNWTVGKEILGVIWILVCIAAGIIVFHERYYRSDFAHPLLVFLLVVFVGSIPVSLSVLSRFAYLYKKYTFVAENGKDTHTVKDLLFVEVTDHYTTLVYLEEGRVKRDLIRSSLNKLAQVEGGGWFAAIAR